MLQHALTVTAVLVLVSLFSKLLADEHHAGGRTVELLQQALHMRDVATQDADPALRLQHAASAVAFLQAARTMARDADLERESGVDVPRLARSLEARVMEARQSVRPPSAYASSAGEGGGRERRPPRDGSSSS